MSAKPLLRALAGERVWPPPVWLMRQAGRYLPEYRELRARAAGFLDFCYTPALAVEATLQPLRRFPLDAAILFSDILVVPDALGADVAFVEGEGPRLRPVTTGRELAALAPERLEEHLQPVFATIGDLRAALPATTALIGFSGAPWTLAAYMTEGRSSPGFDAARALARRDPAFFGRLIDLLTDAVGRYLELQVAAGAEALQIFDSWAGCLAPDELEPWSIAPCRRIAERLRASCPDVPLILFPRGIGSAYPAVAAAVPVAGLGLDQTLSADWAARHLRARPLCLQGNLDPAALHEPAARLLAEAERTARALGAGPHIFNLGHGVVPRTDPEAVACLVRHLKSLSE